MHLDVGRRHPGQHLRRGVEPQRLLHPGIDRDVARPHRVALAGVGLCPVGGVAGHDHQEQEGHDVVVVEAIAVDLGHEQRRGEVVGGRAAALGDHLVVVLVEREGRLDAGRGHVVHALLPVHQQVGQTAQLVAVGNGHAHELADDVHRQLAGEVTDEIGLARLHRLVEVADGQFTDARLEVEDPPRGEPPRHQRPHARVPWRIHRQERHRLVRVGARRQLVEADPVAVGEVGRVAERRDDIGMTRQGPELELVVAIERRLGAEPGVSGIRIFVDVVVVGAVAHRARGQLGRHGLPPAITSAATSARRSPISS